MNFEECDLNREEPCDPTKETHVVANKLEDLQEQFKSEDEQT